MDTSIFAFIWRHSKRQQLLLLLVTVLSFPFLYLTLELPKRIINDAIGGGDAPREIAGLALSQVELLAILCAGFLAAVLAQGLMKMQVNTMKGVLAERLLRRFRYQLIDRILRFPTPHFRRTSQGELVSMVTAETEPMGQIMGDLIAQPIFQGGMMLTIVTFLFLQNPWLGLAAVALIPLQGWLIPKLQRRINFLNKERVREVRQLAQQIGENAAGAQDLRVAGGWRRRMAEVSDRLGRLYQIRYRIYRQKFFMKFLNNFITQLTPFFFFSIGGYLAITGELTVGALVAALAAYKDLSGPWKELLTWYNQTQDMGLRWQVVTERFVPPGMIDETLFHGEPAEIPRLRGPIEMRDVVVRDGDGGAVLQGATVDIPPGSMVAVASRSSAERRAFAEVISREVMPASGTISIAGHDLAGLHQGVIARRIGHTGPRPYLFSGTIGDNLTMALQSPPAPDALDDAAREAVAEARRAGNSADPAMGEWLDVGRAGVEDREGLCQWWLKLVEAIGSDTYLFERGLDARFDAALHPELAQRLVELRPEVERRIQQKGLSRAVHRFEEEAFNPGLPVAGNLLFATPTATITSEAMAEDDRFQGALEGLGLERDLMKLAQSVMDTLGRTFGPEGSEHTLFRNLGIDAALYARLYDIACRSKAEARRSTLTRKERRLLMTVPFRFSAEQMGEAFPDTLRDKILMLRKTRMAEMRAMAGEVFAPIKPCTVASGLTVLENAVFGKIALDAGAKGDKLRQVVADILLDAGLKAAVAELIYDVPTAIGGSNLPQVAHERISFVRAAIKRPDILLLDQALASDDRDRRLRMRQQLRALLPDTTLIFLEEDFVHRDSFDVFIEIEDGCIVSGNGVHAVEDDPATAALNRKLRLLEKTDMFSKLERRQLRLLALYAQWITAEPGDVLFHAGDQPDGAYLLAKGQAELRWPEWKEGDRPLSVVDPNRVVGDLAVLLGEQRRVDMVATQPLKALRINSADLLAIIRADIAVASTMLTTVAGYLMEAGGRLREARRGVVVDGPIPSQPPQPDPTADPKADPAPDPTPGHIPAK
ncbi:MAG: ABC transporter transmembrane domain-containing protein [Pseudomonadota bacterium]